MTHEIVDWLEGIVFGGVALTADALRHATEGQELTFTQWRAILLVGDSEKGSRVGEVARFLHSSLPTTSRLLRRLERRGLLTLTRDEEDRRATRARLTADGRSLRLSVLAYRRDQIAQIVAEVKPGASSHRALRELSARFDARGNPSGSARRPTSTEPGA